MSYLVLARKLRPQRFQDLIGQESIYQTLKNALKTERVAHAFLFTGPRGTGKTSCARILTKALNCTALEDLEPCNKCENCLEINQGISADVMEIDAASNRGIDHIRELRESVKFSPSKGKYKTYIIDEVHMLTTESFNALLKTLEEPPSHVKFILATTDPHKIPITVVSRCQRFDFGYIPTTKMSVYLSEVAKREQINISMASLKLISSAAVGGMRDALTSLDMLVSFTGNQIDDHSVSTLLGLGGVKETEQLLGALVHRDLGLAMDLLNSQMRKGRSLDRLVSDLMTGFKDLSLIKELPPEKLGWRDFLSEQLEVYQSLAAHCSTAQLQQMFHILIETEQQMRRSNQGLICLEMAMVKLCRLERVKGVSEILALLSGGKGLKKKVELPGVEGSPSGENTSLSSTPQLTLSRPEPVTEAPAPVAAVARPMAVDAPKTVPPVLAPAVAPAAKRLEPLPVEQATPERIEPNPSVVEPAKPELAVVTPAEPKPKAVAAAPKTQASSFGSSDDEDPEDHDPRPLDLNVEAPSFVAVEPWEAEYDYDPSPEEMGEPPDWVQDSVSTPVVVQADPSVSTPPPVAAEVLATSPPTRVAPKAEAVEDLSQTITEPILADGPQSPAVPLWAAVEAVAEGEDATWSSFVARFGEEAPLDLWALLKSCVAIEFGPKKLQLGCFNPLVFSPAKQALITEFAAKFFGVTPKLEFVLSGQGQQESLRAKELQQREVDLGDRRDRAASDVTVQAIRQAFPQSQIIDYPNNPETKE